VQDAPVAGVDVVGPPVARDDAIRQCVRAVRQGQDDEARDDCKVAVSDHSIDGRIPLLEGIKADGTSRRGHRNRVLLLSARARSRRGRDRDQAGGADESCP